VVATSDVTLRGKQAGKRVSPHCAGFVVSEVNSLVSWRHVDANDWGICLIAALTYVELAKPGGALWPL